MSCFKCSPTCRGCHYPRTCVIDSSPDEWNIVLSNDVLPSTSKNVAAQRQTELSTLPLLKKVLLGLSPYAVEKVNALVYNVCIISTFAVFSSEIGSHLCTL